MPTSRRSSSVSLLVSVVAGDAHRQLGVDERVESDDELMLGVDREDERHVDAGRIVAERVGLLADPRGVAEADLEAVLGVRAGS